MLLFLVQNAVTLLVAFGVLFLIGSAVIRLFRDRKRGKGGCGCGCGGCPMSEMCHPKKHEHRDSE